MACDAHVVFCGYMYETTCETHFDCVIRVTAHTRCAHGSLHCDHVVEFTGIVSGSRAFLRNVQGKAHRLSFRSQGTASACRRVAFIVSSSVLFTSVIACCRKSFIVRLSFRKTRLSRGRLFARHCSREDQQSGLPPSGSFCCASDPSIRPCRGFEFALHICGSTISPPPVYTPCPSSCPWPTQPWAPSPPRPPTT